MAWARDDTREELLLSRVAAQDREAFRQLYQSYYRRLARFLGRLTHRQEIAEEIINDTLWIVWRNARSFRRGSRVSTWILGIAYRHGLRTLRQQQGLASADFDVETRGADLDSPVRDHADWIERALARLPPEQRVALELCYYFGYSLEEIAEIMRCPLNTVKTRMYRARQRMRTLLADLER